MSQRSVVAVVLLLAGIVVLAVTLWARSGASPLARSWMSSGPAEEWMQERVVVLGAPILGVILLCAAALAAPGEIAVLRWPAIIVLVLLILPVLYFIAAFIPLPDLLYPKWARAVRRHRKQMLAAWRSGGRWS